MKRRTYQLFVEDILEAMDKIERYIKGLTYETFVKNEMVADAGALCGTSCLASPGDSPSAPN